MDEFAGEPGHPAFQQEITSIFLITKNGYFWYVSNNSLSNTKFKAKSKTKKPLQGLSIS
jgi:hypothetical protein